MVEEKIIQAKQARLISDNVNFKTRAEQEKEIATLIKEACKAGEENVLYLFPMRKDIQGKLKRAGYGLYGLNKDDEWLFRISW